MKATPLKVAAEGERKAGTDQAKRGNSGRSGSGLIRRQPEKTFRQPRQNFPAGFQGAPFSRHSFARPKEWQKSFASAKKKRFYGKKNIYSLVSMVIAGNG
ncbi:MAG: hypothetical protein HYS86_04090 [Candidatus Chisholmbacteria bacterium]|nr:hypothetical protein [Candidatus Chisholmbacteria bacterium]